jgi:hypothetical protein
MFPRIQNVQHVQAYTLRLSFTDGTEAEMDFADRVPGRSGGFCAID